MLPPDELPAMDDTAQPAAEPPAGAVPTAAPEDAAQPISETPIAEPPVAERPNVMPPMAEPPVREQEQQSEALPSAPLNPPAEPFASPAFASLAPSVQPPKAAQPLPPQPAIPPLPPMQLQGAPPPQGRWPVREKEPPPPGRNLAIALAIIAPNVVALLLLGLTWLILNRKDVGTGSVNRSGTYILAEFVLIPLLMGICAAFCLRNTRTGLGVNVLVSFANTVIGIAASYLVLHEGVICLIMVSPLLASFIALGGLLGRVVFQAWGRRLQISLAPILILLLIADACATHDFQNSVTDTITIKASPAHVWKYVIDYPAIQDKPDYWLWKAGLPAPVQSTATGHFVGALRRCVFEHDVAFDERIVALEPERRLTFEVIHQPEDPEIMGHLDLQRGQMTLRDNHDGTTTLIGTTWYRLKVYPTVYYDAWTQDIMRKVHLRVMRHIGTLAEQDHQVLYTRRAQFRQITRIGDRGSHEQIGKQ